MRLGTLNLSCYDGMHTTQVRHKCSLAVESSKVVSSPANTSFTLPANAHSGVEKMESLMHNIRNNLHNLLKDKSLVLNYYSIIKYCKLVISYLENIL